MIGVAKNRMIARAGCLSALVAGFVLVCGSVFAQQIVESSTGKQIAGHQCAVSEAFLAEIGKSDAARKADTRASLNAMLDAALASPKTRGSSESSVVFPPPRPGS